MGKIKNNNNKQPEQQVKTGYDIFNQNFYRFSGKSPVDYVEKRLINGDDVRTIKTDFENMAEAALSIGGKYIGFADYFVIASERVRLKNINNSIKHYNKLVRDNIPDIIEASGSTCETQKLNTKEYICALNTKLKEEVNEYISDESLEELADILEVMGAIVKAKGYTWDQLNEIRKNKKAENGGFDKKIMLLTVKDKQEIRRNNLNSNKLWHKSEDTKLEELYSSGASFELLSDYFGRTEYDIIGRLLQLGLF